MAYWIMSLGPRVAAIDIIGMVICATSYLDSLNDVTSSGTSAMAGEST
eukprot:CAMPEP_0203672526 /NCGR_PEP_ID=MMETSP0090-20130426/8569_1 /ASSEMBLY_ACC=CAM_ASM_001088 /TAXON_ID=426623 /ORGANISM="Chaetoceros affinis, Strain CCMP159" /LENGTH=47 /DNA_ID= /DNA_START= /DNA_END= /DNA_ORIENTATION=